MIAIKSVNGAEPAIEPDSFSIEKTDLYSDSTGRSAETGRMLSYPIRLGIYKIELEYSGNAVQIQAIEELFSGTSLTVIFNDCGTYTEREMYPSDRTRSAITLRKTQLYTLSLSLVEY